VGKIGFTAESCAARTAAKVVIKVRVRMEALTHLDAPIHCELVFYACIQKP
jgi:hypothetical protein